MTPTEVMEMIPTEKELKEVKELDKFIDFFVKSLESAEEFETLFDEQEGFACYDIAEIVGKLKSLGWDKEKIQNFGKWFIVTGIIEEWILDELGWR